MEYSVVDTLVKENRTEGQKEMSYIVGSKKEVGCYLALLMTSTDDFARKEKEEIAWTHAPSHN